MFEITRNQDLDVLSLQALPMAGSIVTDEVAQLGRRHRGRGARKVNVCLISLQNLLNDVDILNIFGGGLGL